MSSALQPHFCFSSRQHLTKDFERVFTYFDRKFSNISLRFDFDIPNLRCSGYRYLADRQVFSHNLIVVRSGEQMRRLLAHIDKSRPQFINFKEFSSKANKFPMDMNYSSVLGTIDDIPSYVRSNDVDDVEFVCRGRLRNRFREF